MRDAPADDRSRDPDCRDRVLQVTRVLEHALHHLLGGEVLAGDEAPALAAAVYEELHVRAADVHCEDGRCFRLERQRRCGAQVGGLRGVGHAASSSSIGWVPAR